MTIKQKYYQFWQLFIAEVTLFFNKQDLDLAIGLSLTIMLVMYTMYQSISQSLPQTAYLKFIDVWLMFCLLVPFLVFVVQVFLKLEFHSKNEIIPSKGGNQERTRKRKENVSKFIHIIIPSITILFTCGYFVVAMHFYFKP